MDIKKGFRKLAVMIALVVLVGNMGGCGAAPEIEEVVSSQATIVEEPETKIAASGETMQESSMESVLVPTVELLAEQMVEPATEPTSEPVTDVEKNGRLIVIDPGHQGKGNSDKEPIGPGATEMKAKVASGTKGCVSGLYEYELTLMVSEKLCQELKGRGYEVIMVRTSHDVNISNAERAQVANEAGADVFIRIHANGSDNTSVSGIETLCQTASNPYNAAYYEESRALSEQVLEGMVNAAGAKKRSVVETDTMSGINWCQVPVTIVEMGFMTNEAEDSLMATEDYQTKLAQGMADGIDAYFYL